MEYNYCPEKKGYKKVCRTCGLTFYGRINKDFCTPFCKSAFHNRKDSIKNAMIKKEKKAMLKDAEFLKKLYLQYNGKKCPAEKLNSPEFESDVPLRFILKDKVQYKAIGDYAYRHLEDKQYIEIIKIR